MEEMMVDKYNTERIAELNKHRDALYATMGQMWEVIADTPLPVFEQSGEEYRAKVRGLLLTLINQVIVQVTEAAKVKDKVPSEVHAGYAAACRAVDKTCNDLVLRYFTMPSATRN